MNYHSLLQEASAHREQMITDRHYLHSHAEVDFNLQETTAYVKQKLIEMGYDSQPCGRAGIVALAAGHPDHGHCHSLHHPQVTFSEEALPVGSAVHACMAMRWLEEHA